jgi:hypothetical protein
MGYKELPVLGFKLLFTRLSGSVSLSEQCRLGLQTGGQGITFLNAKGHLWAAQAA